MDNDKAQKLICDVLKAGINANSVDGVKIVSVDQMKGYVNNDILVGLSDDDQFRIAVYPCFD